MSRIQDGICGEENRQTCAVEIQATQKSKKITKRQTQNLVRGGKIGGDSAIRLGGRCRKRVSVVGNDKYDRWPRVDLIYIRSYAGQLATSATV